MFKFKFDRFKNESEGHEEKRNERKESGLPEQYEEETLRSGKNRKIISTPNSEKYDGSDPNAEELMKDFENKYVGKFIPLDDMPLVEEEIVDEDLEDFGEKDPRFADSEEEAISLLVKQKHINQINQSAKEEKLATEHVKRKEADEDNLKHYKIDYPKKGRASQASKATEVIEDKK